MWVWVPRLWSSCSRPGFCPRDWMKAPTANRVVGSIFSLSWRKRLGGNRASIQSWYSSKENSGLPTRKLLGPKPSKGVSQLSELARFLANASTLGERGATIPHPKIPTLRRVEPPSGARFYTTRPGPLFEEGKIRLSGDDPVPVAPYAGPMRSFLRLDRRRLALGLGIGNLLTTCVALIQ